MSVWVSVPGQVDNVGDTVLRRGLLEALRPLGTLHVFVGDHDDAYCTGLRLRPEDVVHRSVPAWRRDVARAVLSGRATYAYNAGEMIVDRRYVASYARFAPLLAAGRLRGGRAVHTGFGIRASNPRWNWALRAALAPVDVVTWRDPVSAETIRRGRVTPDWAFREGASTAELEGFAAQTRRPALGIALRYDRPAPTPAWVRAVGEHAEAAGYEVVVLAQIARDSPRAQELADALDGVAVTWDGPEHLPQEERLREAYRRCDVVISDRLHALVIAATEGALPLALADAPGDKTVRTLAAVGLGEHAVDRRGSEDVAVLGTAVTAASAARAGTMARVVEARRRLDDLAQQLLTLRSPR
ncbi:hypothetical protein C8046_16085 [Serinibacter arcticus]|uniref:Polysaccharide pyruvyl transferase domain-containing protein n=1 Tax=Serinibacter arcticus TaxID=1655435 RepID=A0A2U1ZY81_9MICO|nr:polysaccharide pyruvyl transferase family protein [Serinibacter arcticus]PWD51939.1 hypothetical protein C8046_16085 [Serinibacter arcticus]